VALSDDQAKLLAAALYEIRFLLQTYSGDDVDVQLAERLAYALHNDAMSVIEGNTAFDISASRRRIEIAQQLTGGTYSDGFGILRSSPK